MLHNLRFNVSHYLVFYYEFPSSTAPPPGLWIGGEKYVGKENIVLTMVKLPLFYCWKHSNPRGFSSGMKNILDTLLCNSSSLTRPTRRIFFISLLLLQGDFDKMAARNDGYSGSLLADVVATALHTSTYILLGAAWRYREVKKSPPLCMILLALWALMWIYSVWHCFQKWGELHKSTVKKRERWRDLATFKGGKIQVEL